MARKIAVRVNLAWSAKQFLISNWQWIFGELGTMFFGIGGFLGKRWFERKYGKLKPE